MRVSVSTRASVALALLSVQVNAAPAPGVSLDAARAALSSGDAPRAVSIYEALTQRGESLEAELGLVRAALQAGEFRKAMSWATLTAGEHPESAEAGALLAYLQDRVGHTEQALGSLKALRASKPDAAAPIAAQADILIDRLGAAQASTALDEFLAGHPRERGGDLSRLAARAQVAQRSARLGENEPLSGPAAPSAPANPASPAGAWPRPFFESLPIRGGRMVAAGNGIVVDGGRRVLTYAAILPKTAATIFARNGLGKVRRATRAPGDQQGELVRLQLDEPFPAANALPEDRMIAPEGVRFCFALGYTVPQSLEGTYPAVAPGLVFRANAGIGGLMQITSALGTGHAGSPVFDPRGRLVGVAVGAGEILVGGDNLRNRVGTGHFALRVVPVPAAAKAAAAKPPRPEGPLPPMPAIEELYERLTPAIVQLIAVQ